MQKFIITVFLVQGMITAVHSATVGWTGDQNNSVATISGVLLNGTTNPASSRALLQLGFFNTLSGSGVSTRFAQGKSGTPAAFQEIINDFQVIATARVGDAYPGVNGVWGANAFTLPNQYTGRRLSIWAFDGSTVDNSMQWGIFTNPTAPNWVIPSDSPTPGSTNIDIREVPTDASGLLVGSFGGPPDANFGTSPYKLDIVPEPASLLLSAVGLITMASRRRRNRN